MPVRLPQIHNIPYSEKKGLDRSGSGEYIIATLECNPEKLVTD